METIDVGFGREAAARHPLFVAAYRIVKDERGVRVEGGSPDGRCAGTCDRCGVAILNVFVFGNRARDSFMHVGIDCAAKMGIPAEELRKARGHWAGVAREARGAAARATRAEYEAAQRALRAAREVAHESLLAELRSLRADPNASDYERTALGEMIAYTIASDEGGDWMEPGSKGYDDRGSEDMRDRLQSIRDRLSLCATSRPVVSGKKGLSVKLRAYRQPVRIPGAYGTTYICFLTDDAGNAFVYKGSRCFMLGREIEATWTTDGTDVRDGLTSTVLKRPRKEKVEPEGPTAAQLVVAGALGLDPAVVVPNEFHESDNRNAVHFKAGGMEYGLADARGSGGDDGRRGTAWSPDYGWHEAPVQGNAVVHGWVLLCRKPEDRPDHEQR